MERIALTWPEIHHRARGVGHRIRMLLEAPETLLKGVQSGSPLKVLGVPRGGIHAALAVHGALMEMGAVSELVTAPIDADVIIDDVIDSGRTRDRFAQKWPDKPFFALVDKTDADSHWMGKWIQFPWEFQSNEMGVEENVTRLLEYVGEDPTREGLRETPQRVCQALKEMCSGYKQDPMKVIKTFEDGTCDEMVLLKGISLDSLCEHHLLNFRGVAHVAYIPDGKIIGVSKLARVVDIFSKRLQVQERLTTQITKALDDGLKPKGSACVIEASHSCMGCRGVRKQGATMVTSSLTGVFRLAEVRSEFLGLIGCK